jgi:diaminohydroxyphosphoribosylaminopyrimidine deaminase/5-amino-6-(5-phosphoribosylamino)uracil reductase
MTDPEEDARWMRRALFLARRAEGRTSPNPLVGAVVVRGGRAVGEGFHPGPGRPHAEALALAAAGRKARGATLYVTLEPCVHTDKRTPPCAPAVIRAGLARVVVGMRDPNPKVAGRGVAALKAAGIATTVGCEEARCKRLNAPYVRALATGLPWVTLKVAQTLDGKVATARGESRWITGAAARRHGHALRARNDVILVGIGTVLADDPALTCRLVRGRSPVRVVVDARLETPPTARVLTEGRPTPTILATLPATLRGTRVRPGAARRKALEAAGARLLAVRGRGGRVDLGALLMALAAEGRHRVLCEGGPNVAAALVRGGLANRVAFYTAPRILGGDDARGAIGGAAPARLADALRLGPLSVRRLGDDVLLEADVEGPKGAREAAVRGKGERVREV